jgi:hypothetical protein
MKKPIPKNKAAQALGRLGGSANTKAQQRARKRNAKLAGRPGRVCSKCFQPVLGGHVDRRLDDSCGRHGWMWMRAGKRHPAPPNPEREALDAMAAAMSGRAWDADVCDTIAGILRGTGRTIAEVSEVTT